MSIEGLVVLLIELLVIGVIAYAVMYFLGQAGAPAIIANIVWFIAALIALLMLLRFAGVLNMHLSMLPTMMPLIT